MSGQDDAAAGMHCTSTVAGNCHAIAGKRHVELHCGRGAVQIRRVRACSVVRKRSRKSASPDHPAYE